MFLVPGRPSSTQRRHGYASPVTFTYTITDGKLVSTPATVTINVQFVNHPPVAVDDKPPPIGLGAGIYPIDVLANDHDPDVSFSEIAPTIIITHRPESGLPPRLPPQG